MAPENLQGKNGGNPVNIYKWKSPPYELVTENEWAISFALYL
jgi:hypothetical protein